MRLRGLATLGSSVREDLFGADWHLAWVMRNRIAHGYLLVDIVRRTVERDVPLIVARIQNRTT